MIKIISGYSEKGGSTTAFINLTNAFTERSLDCTFYGPHSWPMDKCRFALINTLEWRSDDLVIAHFLQLPERPNVDRILLSCHEKWWFRVGQIKQYWDEIIFLHAAHRDYHSDYHGKYAIIPNLKEPLILKDKPELDLVAGIVGSIEDRKQTHISIQRALKDKCKKIILFGHIGDQGYFDAFVKPLLNSKVTLYGHTTSKQEMYDMVGRVYHSSKGEVACLVKDECFSTNTKFFGNTETEHEVSTLTNDEIIALWIKELEI